MSKVIYSTAIFVLALAEASVTSDFDQALAEFRKLKEAGASQLRVLMENTDLRKCNTTDNFLSLLNEGYSIYGKLQASFDAGQQIFNSTHGEPTPQQVKEAAIAFLRSNLFGSNIQRLNQIFSTANKDLASLPRAAQDKVLSVANAFSGTAKKLNTLVTLFKTEAESDTTNM
ncbi:unnamed protein product [Bemisia tabaci]|uniref:Uncharacterized protein n=1 Tax=Bemisia tabaci TaxID=7038 RepID=A0A9P0A0L8_BEMTA|nr:unnamed protein product [Bemisia tabaci]